MSSEEIKQKEEVQSVKDDSVIQNTNQKIVYDTEYVTSEEDNQESEEGTQESDEDTQESEDGTVFGLKPNTELFVVSLNGVPQFYTKDIEIARNRMWDFAKNRRIRETQYNTYIRGYPDKNRIEVVGCNRFSVFFVDRVICRLLVSQIQELSNFKEDDTVTPPLQSLHPLPSCDREESEPEQTSPPKRGFFSSFFW
jgi:hypothetical protein